MIEISEVKSKADIRKFIHFPDALYKGDPNYVREPNAVLVEMFDRKKNPFFTHSKVEFFLARKENRISGRIALIRNNVHLSYHKENCGFFGFFETAEDYEVAKALLDTASDWCRKEGLKCIAGPENFSTNESCGMLVSGFDSPPIVMMPYNKPYYNDFLTKYGFEKAMDMSSYMLTHKRIMVSDSLKVLTERFSNKLTSAGVTFRNIEYKKLDNEISQFREVYNHANRHNYGFIPLSESEFRETAHTFSKFVPEEMMLFAEKDRKLIGFIVALPDLNQAFIHLKSGKLYPAGFLKYMWYKRKINCARILILGVTDEYRNRGVDLVLYDKLKDNLISMGILHGEACYIMENNLRMNTIIEKIGGIKTKKYRLYKYAINHE